jgi:hypothetical protein
MLVSNSKTLSRVTSFCVSLPSRLISDAHPKKEKGLRINNSPGPHISLPFRGPRLLLSLRLQSSFSPRPRFTQPVYFRHNSLSGSFLPGHAPPHSQTLLVAFSPFRTASSRCNMESVLARDDSINVTWTKCQSKYDSMSFFASKRNANLAAQGARRASIER